MSQFNALRSATNPDQIYFDVTATNFSDFTTPPPKFYYNERREAPFIEKPEDYYLTISRFTCETNSLPVFIPTIASVQQQGKKSPFDADPNLTIYSVTLQLVDRSVDPPQYGDYYTIPIIWKPQDQSIPPPPFLANGTQDNTTGYYNCTSFSYLTYLIQEALNTAFCCLDAQLSSKSVTNPATIPPIFGWDSVTQKAFFCVETAGYVMGGSYQVSISPSAQITNVWTPAVSVVNSDLVDTQSAAMDYIVDNETAFTNVLAKSTAAPKVGGGSGAAAWFNNLGNKIKSGFQKSVNGIKTAATDLTKAVKAIGENNSGGAAIDAGKAVKALGSTNPAAAPITQPIANGFGNILESGGQKLQEFQGNNPNEGSGNNPSRPTIIIQNPNQRPPIYSKLNYAGTNRVLEVFFNAPLFQLFNSFPAFGNGFKTELATGQRNYRFIFANLNGIGETQITPTYGKTTNPIKVTTIIQEYSTIANISPITSVVFCSNTLPIVPNLVSTPLVYNDSQIISKGGVDAAFVNVITDLASTDGNYRPYLVYLPSAQYRYITLRGNQPLYNLDLTIFYRTKYGDLIPFTLASGASVTIKLAFIKKSSIGNKELV